MWKKPQGRHANRYWGLIRDETNIDGHVTTACVRLACHVEFVRACLDNLSVVNSRALSSVGLQQLREELAKRPLLAVPFVLGWHGKYRSGQEIGFVHEACSGKGPGRFDPAFSGDEEKVSKGRLRAHSGFQERGRIARNR